RRRGVGAGDGRRSRRVPVPRRDRRPGDLTSVSGTLGRMTATQERTAATSERVLPKIVSVDDHVVEPPHVWQTWLPEKHRERGPRVERKKWGEITHLPGARYEMSEDPEGIWGDAWYLDGRQIYVHKRFV